MACVFGENWKESDSCCTGAEDYYVLVLVVEVFVPELWVNDLSLEVFDTWDGGFERSFIVVIASAQLQPSSTEGLLSRSIGRDIKSPRLVVTRPVGSIDFVVEEDLLVNAEHLSRLLDIVDDQVSLSNGGVLSPVSPWEAEGVQIGVRTKPRVLEQAPGTTDFVPAFKDDVAEFRIALLKTVGAIDARYSGTDDNYIVVEDIALCGHTGGKFQ